jgi:hypothetical protein
VFLSFHLLNSHLGKDLAFRKKGFQGNLLVGMCGFIQNRSWIFFLQS